MENGGEWEKNDAAPSRTHCSHGALWNRAIAFHFIWLLCAPLPPTSCQTEGEHNCVNSQSKSFVFHHCIVASRHLILHRRYRGSQCSRRLRDAVHSTRNTGEGRQSVSGHLATPQMSAFISGRDRVKANHLTITHSNTPSSPWRTEQPNCNDFCYVEKKKIRKILLLVG